MNPDYALAEEAAETRAPCLDQMRSGSKNRVGDFFSESRECVEENRELALIITIEIEVCVYETASGRLYGRTTDPVTLHKYLYANAAPHQFIDPSGNFSIAEISVTNVVIGILAGIGIGGTLGGVDALLDNDPNTTFFTGARNGAISGGLIGGTIGVFPALIPTVLVGGAGLGGFSVGSAINDGNAKLATFRALATSFAFLGAAGRVPRSPVRSQVASSQQSPGTTPLVNQPKVQNIPDDAFVHFSPTAPASGSSITGFGNQTFFFRYGDIKNLSPRQIEFLIGDQANSGVTGSARFLNVVRAQNAETRPLGRSGFNESFVNGSTPVVETIRVQ